MITLSFVCHRAQLLLSEKIHEPLMKKGGKKKRKSAVSTSADTAVVPTEPVSANEQIIRKMKDLVLRLDTMVSNLISYNY